MAFVVDDRVMETSTSTGTGDFTLAGAVTGFRRFSAVCATSDTTPYTIEGVDANGVPTGEWETGLGTYSAANTLTRTTVKKSSNSNAAVSFSVGTKRVSISATAYLLTLLAGGGLLGKQIFTSGSGTYTPTEGTGSIVIEMVGGGAGGGGCVGAGSGSSAGNGGGGGGAYAMSRLTADFSGGSWSVGAAGVGGAAGANAGTAGGDTTFTTTAGSPVTITAGGGQPSGGSTGGASSGAVAFGSGNGGTATNGDLNIPGETPPCGRRNTGGNAEGGPGGNSRFGAGGKQVATFSSGSAVGAGNDGQGYGAGGSGACSGGSGSTAKAGGNGTGGLIIVWELTNLGAAPAAAGVPDGGATGQVLTKQSGVDQDTGWGDPALPPSALFEDQKAANTAGGGSTAGSWLARTLNTEVFNEISGASLASNQITLPAGDYEVDAHSCFAGKGQHRCRLRDVTNSVTLVLSDNWWSTTSGSQAAGQMTPRTLGRFTLSGSAAVELQYQAATASATNGLGIQSNFGEVEVYSRVLLRKIG